MSYFSIFNKTKPQPYLFFCFLNYITLQPFFSRTLFNIFNSINPPPPSPVIYFSILKKIKTSAIPCFSTFKKLRPYMHLIIFF